MEIDLAYQAYGPLHAINQLLLYIAVTVACHNIGPAKKGGRGGGGLAVAPSFSPYVVNVMQNSTYVLDLFVPLSLLYTVIVYCVNLFLIFYFPFFFRTDYPTALQPGSNVKINTVNS